MADRETELRTLLGAPPAPPGPKPERREPTAFEFLKDYLESDGIAQNGQVERALDEIEAELRDLARLRKALDTQTFVLESNPERDAELESYRRAFGPLVVGATTVKCMACERANEDRSALEARTKRAEAQDLKELLETKREASAQRADLEIKNIDNEPGVRDLLADVNKLIAEDATARLQKAAEESRASDCDHGVTFDADAARGLGTREIRERWPRLFGPCPKGCGFNGIGYADFTHYLAGDW
jgi:hypothetical protein